MKHTKLLKSWKLIGGGLIASTLLATSIVAPLTVNQHQVKQINLINRKQTSFNPSLTTKSSNTIGTETTADTFFTGTNVSGTVYYTQDGQNITIVTGTTEQFETLNSIYGDNLTLKTNFSLGGQNNCNVVAIEDYAFVGNDIRGSLDLSKDTKLTSIGASAFYSSYFITSVSLPSSVTSISAECFGDCRKLEQVSLSNNVTQIGDSAFYGDTQLSSFPFTSLTKLQTIGESTFLETSITDVYIPATVTTIDDNAFESCPIQSISLANDNATFTLLTTNEGKMLAYNDDLQDESGTLKWCDSSTVCGNLAYGKISFNSENTISTLTQISTSAFTNCVGITSVELPGFTTCTTIGAGAFANCTSLNYVAIPNNITSIGNNCFSLCSLQNIVLVNDSQSFTKVSLGSGYAILSGSGASWTDSSVPVANLVVGDITIPTGIQAIAEDAFTHSLGVKSVSFPASLTSIGDSAFDDDTNLTNVDLSKCSQLNDIQRNAFSRTTLQHISFCGSTNYKMFNFKNGGAIIENTSSSSWTNTTKVVGGLAYGEIDLSDSEITTIPTDAFGTCFGITSFIYPTTLTSLGENACSGCINATSYTYLNNDPSWLQYNEDSEVYSNPADNGNSITIYLTDQNTITSYLNYITENADQYEACYVLSYSLSYGFIQFKTLTPDDDNDSNLGLILGLSLGIGIPVVAGTITGIVVGVKKHKKKAKKPTSKKKK